MHTEHVAPRASTSVDLSHAGHLALLKLLSEDKDTHRDALTPGVYMIDECVGFHVRATLTVGDDYTQRLVNKARPWAVVAVLLAELQEHALAAGKTGVDLDRIVAAACALDPDLEKKAQKQADKVAALLKAETLDTCRGKVTISGAVEKL